MGVLEVREALDHVAVDARQALSPVFACQSLLQYRFVAAPAEPRRVFDYDIKAHGVVAADTLHINVAVLALQPLLVSWVMGEAVAAAAERCGGVEVHLASRPVACLAPHVVEGELPGLHLEPGRVAPQTHIGGALGLPNFLEDEVFEGVSVGRLIPVFKLLGVALGTENGPLILLRGRCLNHDVTRL